MRNASPALIAFLNSSTEFYVADLLTVIPVNGPTFYLTSAPGDVTAVSQVDNASHTFFAGGEGTPYPTFTRAAVKLIVGLEVDSMTITLATVAGQTLLGLPLPQQGRTGYFDGARVVLERLYMATWGDVSKGTLINFWGVVGQVVSTRTGVQITVNSDLTYLQLTLPRNLWSPGCLHNVYDAGCTLNRAAFTVGGAAAGGSTASVILTNLAQADGYFELGAITFTSGQNAGLGPDSTRTVKTFTNAGGTVIPTAPFRFAPVNGDAFSIFPGCDKLQATCTTKFANLAHFRGYPYVPAPENAR